MKKLMLIAPAFASVGAFAAEGDNVPAIADLSAGIVSKLQTWATDFGPTLLTVAVAFMAFWLLKLAIKAIKGVASSGK